MALNVSYVKQLSEIVPHVQDYLQQGLLGHDAFHKQTLVVPTIGVRSWLTPQLATRLGASEGSSDGIFANVDVQYVGYLQKLIRGASGMADDPWSRDKVVFATMSALNGFDETPRLEKKYQSRLKAARVIAERFDRYAARRPDLIRSWDSGTPALGELSPEKFEWQFNLWRRVRDIIGASPWPVLNAQICEQLRQGQAFAELPSRLLVAGFESISPSNLELIDALSTLVDINLIFVNQSPALSEKWKQITSHVVPNRHELPLGESFDSSSVTPFRLPATWMKESFDLELLLASFGVNCIFDDKVGSRSKPRNLLQRLQNGVSYLESTATQESNALLDLSVQIHRAHNLSRQVEVLHDALLHAFSTIDDLQPHDVIIFSPDMATAAPVLEAVFEKSLKNSAGRTVRIPLVVADRSLRELSEGAELVANLLDLTTSRFELETFLSVATDSLVARNFKINASDIDVWHRNLKQSRLRWGLDAVHRGEHGLDAPQLSAHSWIESLERSLLGAVMKVEESPTVTPQGIRPLPFVEGSDTRALTKLAGILAIVVQIEEAARSARSIQDWCIFVEEGLVDLCGQSCTEIDDVLFLLNGYSLAANELSMKTSDSSSSIGTVAFADFAHYVQRDLQLSAGRQPLRTGAVTATSFLPLRTVPYKVVCVLGFDEGVLPTGESEGEDLIAALPMIGDSDSRLESRRAFLDALMAAEEQFIVTCTGRSIKNNKQLPLVTPLAEFLDFCSEFGVERPENPDDLCTIEYSHQRHLGSPENFRDDIGPVVPLRWSFDKESLEVAETRVSTQSPTSSVVPPPILSPLAAEIVVSELETLALDPLDYYLKKGLKIWRDWQEKDEGSVLPVTSNKNEIARACRNFYDNNIALDLIEEELRSLDVLPVPPLDSIDITWAKNIVGVYRENIRKSLPSQAENLEIHFSPNDHTTIKGKIAGFHREEKTLELVSFSSTYERDLCRMVLRLLVIAASGEQVMQGKLFHLSGNRAGVVERRVELDESFTADVASSKLSNLLRVEPIARSLACPLFGSTAEVLYAESPTPDAQRWTVAESEFEKFFAKQNLGDRPEIVVFGANPLFEDIYSVDSESLQLFFSEYFKVLAFVEIEKNSAWKLSV